MYTSYLFMDERKLYVLINYQKYMHTKYKQNHNYKR